MWRSELGWSALDITSIVTKLIGPSGPSGPWGVTIFFDPSPSVDVAPGSMTNYWEVRFFFTVSAPPLPWSPIVSTPVGSASNGPVTFFIPFVGYTGEQPSSAFITNAETRGDLDLSSEYIDLRVSTSFQFNTFTCRSLVNCFCI